MLLREVATYRYHVYAVCGFPGEEECEVEKFLQEHQDSYPKAMKDLNTALRNWTPQHGPPFVDERAKRLRDGICEFRAREKRQKKLPRILFFEDSMRIICTNTFFKEGSTPDHEIERAIEIRTDYFRQSFVEHRILRGWALP
ncbi:MAG TPA: type II toxin-antitoxin system RelE/ParE family toxin [Thermoanaerobaculia bacterium]